MLGKEPTVLKIDFDEKKFVEGINIFIEQLEAQRPLWRRAGLIVKLIQDPTLVNRLSERDKKLLFELENYEKDILR